DDLPIPYRAIGTDLNTGLAVTLDHGDVVDAAVASMAVPGLYPPQKVNGFVLVDGGMSKQMPVDVARAMGADIIIAVDLTVGVKRIEEGAAVSAVDTAMRLIDLQVMRNWQQQVDALQPQDIHIRPDMTGLSTYGFDKVREGYERGKKATEAFKVRLQEIAATAAPAARGLDRSDEKIPLAAVKVDSDSGIKESVIINRLG
ncbi:unnamed protein product, partial [Phaeothamnion confervicola]